jgi:glutamyl-tRNA(Gln) amidotransferase subunit E
VSRFRATAPPPSPHDLNPRSDPPLDFPVRALGELSPDDYATLGFLCGLEVHQQLLTERKLFCRCPAGRNTTRVDMEVLRHMRPTLSEMGQYDGCALMEFKTKKEIVYLLERESVCTYEMDDTPPFEIDEQAVKIALEVSSLLGLNLVNELHVMRKQYLDGSIPTGFQRTAMVGVDSVLPFPGSELGADRSLRVRQLTLEEDSCREVSDVGHRIEFRTDRLGMPLIETVTEPDLLTPRDAAAGGRLLAEVARASGKVRRGPGAARQDVNVSVAGGRRVEIKGVPSHRLIPTLVHNEAYRQLELLRLRDALQRRGAAPDALSLGDVEWAWESPLVEVLERGDGERTVRVRLPGFDGLLGHRTQPGLGFFHEIAERVRVIACLEHSALGADDATGTVTVHGPDDEVDTAAREIVARAREAFVGVPSETRQGHADGTTGFERILPGAERMYPDTDTPPVPIPDAWLREIEARLPERPWQRLERYEKLGIPAERAARLARAPWAALFDALGGGPELARALERTLPRMRTVPDVALLEPLLGLPAFALEPAILRVLRGEAPGDVVAALSSSVGTQQLEQRIGEVVAARNEAQTRDPQALLRWAMGRALEDLRGLVDPRVARERLQAELGT